MKSVLKSFSLEQQATVDGKKFMLSNRASTSLPETPLHFANAKMQHQLELMMAINDYATNNRLDVRLPGDLGPLEPELEPYQTPLERYQRQLVERIVPALGVVGDLLLGKRQPGQPSSDDYIKLK